MLFNKHPLQPYSSGLTDLSCTLVQLFPHVVCRSAFRQSGSRGNSDNLFVQFVCRLNQSATGQFIGIIIYMYLCRGGSLYGARYMVLPGVVNSESCCQLGSDRFKDFTYAQSPLPLPNRPIPPTRPIPSSSPPPTPWNSALNNQDLEYFRTGVSDTLFPDSASETEIIFGLART